MFNRAVMATLPFGRGKSGDVWGQEKRRSENYMQSVPTTDTGGLVE
jgi:hypothetical protein